MKKTTPDQTSRSELTARRPYAPPELKRVELALAETLSSGCKLESDIVCVGPPIKAFDGGS